MSIALFQLMVYLGGPEKITETGVTVFTYYDPPNVGNYPPCRYEVKPVEEIQDGGTR
jgi:hypothetical protein